MNIDPYAAGHAKLRWLMREASTAVARIAPDDLGTARTAARAVTRLLEELRRSSARESAILHPLLKGPLAEVRASLDWQHSIIEALIVRVEAVLDRCLLSLSVPDIAHLQAFLREFIATVLPHMEGEDAMAPIFARLVPEDALAAAARALEDEELSS